MPVFRIGPDVLVRRREFWMLRLRLFGVTPDADFEIAQLLENLVLFDELLAADFANHSPRLGITGRETTVQDHSTAVGTKL